MTYFFEYYGTQIEEKPPSVSSRRRLQNRIAQRKFRERKTSKSKSSQDKNPQQWEIDIDHLCTDADGQPCAADQSNYYHGQLAGDDGLSFGVGGALPHTSWNTMGIDSTGFDSSHSMSSNTSSTASPTNLSSTPTYESEYIQVSDHFTAISPMDTSLGYMGLPPIDDQHSPHLIGSEAFPMQQGNFSYQTMRSDSSNSSLSNMGGWPPNMGNNSQGSYETGAMPPTTASSASSASSSLQPLLHVAARSQNRSVVSTLLKRGVATAQEQDSSGRTALHVAAELGDETLVLLLLKYGADPHSPDATGQTPLYLAVLGGHNEVVESLLGRGDPRTDSEDCNAAS